MSRLAPDLGQLTIYQDTPLHLACYSGRLEAAKVLVAAGARAFAAENIWSETPLHAAATSGRSRELVTFLLDTGGLSVNLQGSDGHTALHSACYQGHIDIVLTLLERGADINLMARLVQS